MADTHNTNVKIILEIGGVKIVQAFCACHAPLLGETFAVTLQMFVVVHRYWTTLDRTLACWVVGHPIEMNGAPSKVDREFWRHMRHAANENDWHWSGSFPVELTDTIIQERSKESGD